MLTDLSNEARRRKTTISKLLEDFVEPALYQQPNPETLAAIEEARSGVEMAVVDTSSYDRGKEQEDCSGCWYSLAPCPLPPFTG